MSISTVIFIRTSATIRLSAVFKPQFKLNKLFSVLLALYFHTITFQAYASQMLVQCRTRPALKENGNIMGWKTRAVPIPAIMS